jgi:hypothetical protein
MGPGEEILGVFGWVERRKASQPIGFSDEGRIGIRSAAPMFFWQRDLRWRPGTGGSGRVEHQGAFVVEADFHGDPVG